KVSASPRAHLLRIFLERARRGQDAFAPGSGPQGLHCGVFETGPDARGVGLFRVLDAPGRRFCETLANETNNASAVDWRRKIVRQRACRPDETGRDRCHSRCAKGHWSLDPRGTAKGNESGADKISLTENAGTGTFVDLAKAPALERSCPHETLGLGQEKPSFDRARDSHRSGCDRVRY